MAASFLLSLREGLEAALIIGIVLGVLRQMNRGDLVPAVWQGTGLAVLVSLLAALGLLLIGAKFEGRGEEIFEGIAMFVAAGVLTWMIFWMQRQSRTLKQQIETNVQKATHTSGRNAILLLAFAAVVREGLELSLFLIAAGMASGGAGSLTGAILGLAGAAVAGWLLFTGSKQLNLRVFFTVTNILLVLFAAGLVAHGVHEFNEAGWIPPVIENLWNINPVLDENSIAGSLLKALFGYNGNPSLTEVISYAGFIFLLAIAYKMVTSRPVANISGSTM